MGGRRRIALPRLKELTGIDLAADPPAKPPEGGVRNVSDWIIGHLPGLSAAATSSSAAACAWLCEKSAARKCSKPRSDEPMWRRPSNVAGMTGGSKNREAVQ